MPAAGAVRYTAPAMQTPPDAIPTLATTPGVCVCGYDLTGLPADAAAKCPECGVVIAEIRRRRPWYARWRVVLIACVIPAPLEVAELAGGSSFGIIEAPGPLPVPLVWSALVVYLVASVPVCAVAIVHALEIRSIVARAFVVLASVWLVAMLNVLAFFACLFLVAIL